MTYYYTASSKRASMKAIHPLISSGPLTEAMEIIRKSSLFTEGPIEIRLLSELDAIEREARALLGEDRATSVIRLRSDLQALGVWSESDIYDFDVALRARNQVAHGDRSELSRASLVKAFETMQRLRLKVEVQARDRS
jgi:hypothetical protein